MVDPNQYHIAAVSALNGYIFSCKTADCHVSAAGQDRKYAITLLFHLSSSTSTDVDAAERIFEFHFTLMRKFQVFTFFLPLFLFFWETLDVCSPHSFLRPRHILCDCVGSVTVILFFFLTVFETPVRDTHSHMIDFLTRSQELIVITGFFGKENEMLVWRCWCSSVLQWNDVTHSWATENCKAPLVCKQTWVGGGISGWKYCIFLSKVQCAFFVFKNAYATTFLI